MHVTFPMNPMKTLLALLVVALALPALADFPPGSPPFHKDFKSASKSAKKSGKPMILVFSADWCPPCVMMKKDVYPNEVIKPLHDKFEWAYLDLDIDENIALIHKYKGDPIPHFQFLDSEGNDLGGGKFQGNAKEFKAHIEGFLKKVAK